MNAATKRTSSQPVSQRARASSWSTPIFLAIAYSRGIPMPKACFGGIAKRAIPSRFRWDPRRFSAATTSSTRAAIGRAVGIFLGSEVVSRALGCAWPPSPIAALPRPRRPHRVACGEAPCAGRRWLALACRDTYETTSRRFLGNGRFLGHGSFAGGVTWPAPRGRGAAPSPRRWPPRSMPSISRSARDSHRDPRMPAPLRPRRAPFPNEIEGARVRREEDVGPERLLDFDRMEVILRDPRIAGILHEASAGVDRGATREYHRKGAVPFGRRRDPGRAALRVPGRVAREEAHAAELHGVAVAQDPIDRDRLEVERVGLGKEVIALPPTSTAPRLPPSPQCWHS